MSTNYCVLLTTLFTAAVAHRSFMKVDNCDIKFNKSGKCAIIIASNDVDKTGSRFVFFRKCSIQFHL